MALLSEFSFLQQGLTPALALQIADRHLGWALVLGAMTVFALRAFPLALRMTGFLLVVVACLLPGPIGLTWWLGLAFQIPSLTLQGLCLLYIVRAWQLRHAMPVSTVTSVAYTRWPNSLLWLTVLAGWILALDTFAAFNVMLYPIGFTPYAALAILSVAALLWLLSMRTGHAAGAQRHREVAIVLVGAVAIHVFTRLPSGNVWDAMLDPWLWLSAQALLMTRAFVWIALFARSQARRAVSWISAR